jgi:ABC-type Zn uptake system ZnuABC Zn-binding protein ZnuA
MLPLRRSRSYVARGAAMLVALGALASVGLTACSAVPEPASGLRVVTTTTQITDFTRAVVGPTGTVTGLISPNRSAHSFDPTAAQLVALAQADAVVMNGAGLEPWLPAALTAAGFHGRLIDASVGIPLIAGDPHLWTDPQQAQTMVANIAAGLSPVAGDVAATLERNAQNYEAQLQALAVWAKESIAQVPLAQRLLVTNHDAFAYFVRAYDLTFVGSIIPGFDDNAEPSAAELDALILAIRDSGARAIFSEGSLSPRLATTIAAEAGVRVYSGVDGLFADSLGMPGTAGDTYLHATEHNVSVLVESWGGTPLPLPLELRS